MLIDSNKKQLIDGFTLYISEMFDSEWRMNHLQLLNNFEEDAWNKEMIDKWYKSLEDGDPDYDIYKSSFFLVAGMYCYIKYTRNYIKQLYKNKITNEILSSCKTIVDVGNGTGHSTKALSECFENVEVCGTNINPSYQYQHNQYLQNKMIELSNQQIDCFIFFEFMEHIYNPIEYINNIIQVHKPKVLVFANSFNTRCIGHFKEYDCYGTIIDQKKISRRFNEKLRQLGYKQIKAGLWNNRPSVWTNQVEASAS